MSVTAERKKEVITQYATGEKDTGSPEVQVAVLSERIANLTEHFKTHAKDNPSRRGLIKMVSQRRRLLDYVKSKDKSRYEALIKRLGLRRCFLFSKRAGIEPCQQTGRELRPQRNGRAGTRIHTHQ